MTPHTSRFTHMNQTDQFNVKCGDLTPDFIILKGKGKLSKTGNKHLLRALWLMVHKGVRLTLFLKSILKDTFPLLCPFKSHLCCNP